MSLAPGSRFALRFVALFVLLFAAFEPLRGGAAEAFVVDGLFVQPAAALVRALVPGEPLATPPHQLASPYARLRVLRGCEGIETIFLIAAAVLAYPAPVRRRLAGLALGVPLAYGLGIVRLAALYLGLRFAPHAFELAHGYLAPLVPLIALAGFFLAWSARADGSRAPG